MLADPLELLRLMPGDRVSSLWSPGLETVTEVREGRHGKEVKAGGIWLDVYSILRTEKVARQSASQKP